MGIRKHVYYESCESGDCGGTCPLCTLSICKVCGMAEGGLTTECCGEKVEYEVEQRVYAGELDYRNDQWIKGMRNRFMYKHTENDIVHEKRYLEMLLRASVLDFERVTDSKNMVCQLREILDSYYQET